MNLDSSDDDDDSLLLSHPTFSKAKSRKEANAHKKMDKTLDQLLSDNGRWFENSRRMQEMTQRVSLDGSINNNNNDDDDEEDRRLRENIQRLTHSVPRSRKQSELLFDTTYDGTFSEEVHKKLKSCLISERICRLGLRRGIIRFDSTATAATFFRTTTEAVGNLLGLLNSTNNTQPTFCNDLLNASEFGCISEFLQAQLQTDSFGTRFNETEGGILRTWLVNLACSAGLGDREMELLADTATMILLSLQEKSLCKGEITVQDFNDVLYCWCNDEREGTGHQDSDSANKTCTQNSRGLTNFLLIWENSITWSSDIIFDNAATNCLATLIRLGLDDSVETRLHHLLRRHVANIITVALQNKSSHKERKIWIDNSVNIIIAGMGKLGPGNEDSEDCDDVEACLCRSAAAGVIPTGTTKGDSIETVLWFQAELSLQSIHALLFHTNDTNSSIETCVHKILSASRQETLAAAATSSLSWLAIISPYAVLLELENRRYLEDSPPKFLAIVECSFIAFQAGLRLLATDPSSEMPEKTGAEYATKPNASTVAMFLKVFDALLSKISSRMCKISASSIHYRRAHSLFLHWQTYNACAKDRANYVASSMNLDTGERRHAKISSYFSAKA